MPPEQSNLRAKRQSAAVEREAQDELALYRSSVLVTGGHYALTTLLGRLIAYSDRFHVVTEPNNPFPQWHRALGSRHPYVYHDESRYPDLREGLIRLMTGKGLAADALRLAGQIRSLGDANRFAVLIERELQMRFSPRPAIFKGPFLTFSARTMQREDRIRVVLGMRHPCAWIESIVRRDQGFDFTSFLQPALLEALPGLAYPIHQFASKEQPVLEQAILAWKVFQTFHARYLLGNERTMVVRQDDLVAEPLATAARLFAFVGSAVPVELEQFFRRVLQKPEVDFIEGGPGRYTERNGRAVVEKWRKRLSPDEIAAIRTETEELASAFGYDESHWP